MERLLCLNPYVYALSLGVLVFVLAAIAESVLS